MAERILLTGNERKSIWERYKTHWAKQDPEFTPHVSDFEYIQEYLLPEQARKIYDQLKTIVESGKSPDIICARLEAYLVEMEKAVK